ncbi:MAG: hypothetical protein ACO37F_07545 [Pirellulales bacterium]
MSRRQPDDGPARVVPAPRPSRWQAIRPCGCRSGQAARRPLLSRWLRLTNAAGLDPRNLHCGWLNSGREAGRLGGAVVRHRFRILCRRRVLGHIVGGRIGRLFLTRCCCDHGCLSIIPSCFTEVFGVRWPEVEHQRCQTLRRFRLLRGPECQQDG